MDFAERAKIIALARMLGASGTNDEVFSRFWEEYQKVLSEPTGNVPKVEVVKTPYHR